MKGQKIVVAADDRVGLANQCQRQEFIVFRVAAGGLNVQFIGVRHREEMGALPMQGHKRKPGFGIQLTVKLVAFENMLQLAEGGA